MTEKPNNLSREHSIPEEEERRRELLAEHDPVCLAYAKLAQFLSQNRGAYFREGATVGVKHLAEKLEIPIELLSRIMERLEGVSLAHASPELSYRIFNKKIAARSAQHAREEYSHAL